MRPLILCFIMAAAGLALFTGCDGEYGKNNTCDPGDTRACECSGGEAGEETCDDDGEGWGICECGGDATTDTYPDMDPDADPDVATDPELDVIPEVEVTDVVDEETGPTFHVPGQHRAHRGPGIQFHHLQHHAVHLPG